MDPKDSSLEDMLAQLRTFRDSAASSRAGTTPGDAPARLEDGADLAGHLLDLLRQYAGFRSTPALERKLSQVLRNVNPKDVDHIISGFTKNARNDDLAAIVEDLTNHETFFFRDMMQLDPLRETLLPELIRQRARHDKHLKIWSAACATGEEAYTLAFLALEALHKEGYADYSSHGGFTLHDGWQLTVLGTDISRQAIRVAKDACYLESSFGSFRQMPEGWRRFFSEQSTGPDRYGKKAAYLTPIRSARQHVRLETFNLVSQNPPILNCDLVLCRNVLIYIDTQQHPAILGMLRNALHAKGYLVPSLVDQVADPGFKTRWLNRCAFYEKR